MVGTILPVVHGGSSRKHLGPVVAHAVGAVSGGVVVGASLSLAGRWTQHSFWGDGQPSVGLPILGAMALLFAADEAGLLRVPHPQLHRQVSQRRRRHAPPTVTALRYGVELGAGLTTFVPVTTFYVLLTAVFFVGDPVMGAGVMAGFAGARAAPVAAIAIGSPDMATATRAGDSLLGWEPLVHLVNALVLAGASAYLLTSSASNP